jgi:uracil-DNA glycosylase family 4
MEWLGRLSPKAQTLLALENQIISCRACPRLVQWREEVAQVKRKSYEDQIYWGKPIPSFGSTRPKMLIVGLAPGAHGANRTGRVFTGDSSGDWLYASLFRLGMAKIETSESINDGQKLKDVRIATAVRCAPPENKPTTEERDCCSPYFSRELELIAPTVRAFVALGSFAWTAIFKALESQGHPVIAPKFAHGQSVKYSHGGKEYLIIASFHPSQQNTFTGKLTRPMLDSVLRKAGRFAQVIG